LIEKYSFYFKKIKIRREIFVCILFVFELFAILEAREVSCETVEDFNASDTFGSVRTCRMDGTTVIDEDNMTVATADESVLSLKFDENQKISFLPIQVAEKFPNIISYTATLCSVKTISKKNFAGLTKLRELKLDLNQIERIDKDAFGDLDLLEHLHLGSFFYVSI
jgi:Leucine-rich repeat (LRR) protein